MEASRAVLPGRQPAELPKLPSIPLKRGAERAFEQLYEKHARDVYQYALAVLTNPADAEDVTQQTFLNAFRAYQRGERPLRPHNWLIAIAHNVCRMRWRQANHRPREVALDEAPELVALTDDQPSLDEVLRALARLSFNQRAALVMRELEGRSYKEIAGVLGASVGAVEALLFRARRHMRLQRRSLGVLGTAPLPTSLASSLGLGSGGGTLFAGGAALGTDLALKAAALVAVGAVTAGVGYRAIHAAPTPAQPASSMRASAPAPLAPTHRRTARHPASPAKHARSRQPAHTARAQPTDRARPPLTAPTHDVAPTSAPTPMPQPASPPTTPVVTMPPLPVTPPLLPTPPVQALPVALPTPQLPLPPLK